MPVIKSAIKKLRQDKKREKQNNILRDSVKDLVRAAKKTKSGKAISIAIATIDKASKNKILHKNKAARLKSSLSKIAKPVKSKTTSSSVSAKAKTVQKTEKKKAPKKSAPKTKKASK